MASLVIFSNVYYLFFNSKYFYPSFRSPRAASGRLTKYKTHTQSLKQCKQTLVPKNTVEEIKTEFPKTAKRLAEAVPSLQYVEKSSKTEQGELLGAGSLTVSLKLS